MVIMKQNNQIEIDELQTENNFSDLKNKLEKKGYSVVIINNAEKVRKFIEQNIPDEALVGLDGSKIINDLDIPLYLRKKWNVIVDPFQKKIAREIKDYLHEKLFESDYYITCPDAITKDGKVVFKDKNMFLIDGKSVKPCNVIAFMEAHKILDDIEMVQKELRVNDLTVLEVSPFGLKRGMVDNSGQIEEYSDTPEDITEEKHLFTIVLLAEEHAY